jgi:hypothetical protein
MATYDAFISYSHAKDKPIAASLQSTIQTLGKPWYRRRVLRVFRDDVSLSATPHLWPSIEEALSQSRYLILLASPEAATSPWVAKELLYWLDHKDIDTLLLAVTDGELVWNDYDNDFSWTESTPLPAALTGRIATEPRWVDLRRYRSSAATKNSSFIDLAAEFAATIRGIPKDDLLSQEVRQQRRALSLAWSAVGSLLVLASLVGHQWKLATDAQRAAAQQREAAHQLTQQVTGKDTALSRLNLQIAQLTELLSLEKTGKLSLEEQLGSLRSSLAAAASDRDRYKNLYDGADAQGKAAALAGQLDVEKRISARALAQVEVLNQQIAALRRQLSALEEALDASEKKDKESQSRIADLGQRLNVALVQRVQELQRERDLLVHDRMGDVLMAAGRREEALAEYRESVAIREKLAAADPGNARWQRDLSVSLFRLAGASDAPRVHFVRALEILHQLDAEGKLAAIEKRWIGLIEQRLAELAPEQSVSR